MFTELSCLFLVPGVFSFLFLLFFSDLERHFSFLQSLDSDKRTPETEGITFQSQLWLLLLSFYSVLQASLLVIRYLCFVNLTSANTRLGKIFKKQFYSFCNTDYNVSYKIFSQIKFSQCFEEPYFYLACSWPNHRRNKFIAYITMWIRHGKYIWNYLIHLSANTGLFPEVHFSIF